MLFDKIVTVERRTVSGSYNNYIWDIDLSFGAVPVNIQPMQAEFGNGGISYKNYKCFTTCSGIIEGMRLTVSGTAEQFIVRGRQRFDYIVAPHYELVVEADDQ